MKKAIAIATAVLCTAVAAQSSLAAKPKPKAKASAQAHMSIVATVKASTKRLRVYRIPGQKKPFKTLSNKTWDGAQLTLLVAQRLKGWDRVYLPMRPNGTTGWIHDSAVTLAVDPYRLVVDLGSHRVKVFKGGKLIRSEKAGVGQSVLPTPRGHYYLVELLRQPDPNGPYGPWAFGTSAFSDKLYSFGGGPGEIGLHGTDYPAGLGTNVSHGCIRISNAAITWFANTLPLGTPIDIKP